MKNKLIAALSVLICLAILLFSALDDKSDKSRQYDIVFFGDSIIAGNHNGTWSIPALVEKELGMSTLNAAIGGTTLSDLSSDRAIGDVGALYSLVALSKAVNDDDYSIQIMASQKENEYVDEWRGKVVDELSQICWADVKYIVIEHGANDYLMGTPLDNINDAYDTMTFGGALRSSIEILREKAHNAQIIIMTPIYMFPDGYDRDCYELDFGEGTLDGYVEKEKEIAREYDLILIDNFNEVNINKNNYKSYIPGGLHGNLEGNTLIADNIIKHIKEIDERN